MPRSAMLIHYSAEAYMIAISSTTMRGNVSPVRRCGPNYFRTYFAPQPTQQQVTPNGRLPVCCAVEQAFLVWRIGFRPSFGLTLPL